MDNIAIKINPITYTNECEPKKQQVVASTPE
jgi:hypothetical protein